MWRGGERERERERKGGGREREREREGWVKGGEERISQKLE